MVTMAVQTVASRASPTDLNKVIFVAVVLCAAASLLPRSSADASGFIAKTCRRTPHESLCVSVLQSSRGGSTAATVHDLAVAALDAASAATFRAKMQARELGFNGYGTVNGTAVKTLRGRLARRCMWRYSKCLDAEADVAGMVSARTYGSAVDAAGKLRAFPEKCERIYADRRIPSPLQQVNREVEEKLDVSYDIIRLLR